MKCLYFWVNISIFIKKIQFFVSGQVKFLKFIVFIYIVLNLILPHSTYIYPACLLIKAAKIISFLPRKLTFYIQVYFGICMFCCFIAIRALSYYGNDVHIVKYQMETAFIMFCDIISSIDTH